MAATDTFYVRWSHSFDTYGTNAGTTTVTFHWEESDAWTEERPEELVAEVRAFLALRSSSLPLPATLTPDLQPPPEWDVSAVEIRLALRFQIERRPDLLRLGEGAATAGRLVVRPDRLAVEFAQVTAVTVHLDDVFRPDNAEGICPMFCVRSG